MLLLIGLSLLAAASHLPMLPDDRLTPGVVSADARSAICARGYSTRHRHTSEELKREVYREYGLTAAACGHCEIDHRIPLELGGADAKANLWPQSYDTRPWNAHAKDRLENYVRKQVCDGRITPRDGQNIFRGSWIDAYRATFDQPTAAR